MRKPRGSPVRVPLPDSSPRHLKLPVAPWSVWFRSRGLSQSLHKFVHPFLLFLNTSFPFTHNSPYSASAYARQVRAGPQGFVPPPVPRAPSAPHAPKARMLHEHQESRGAHPTFVPPFPPLEAGTAWSAGGAEAGVEEVRPFARSVLASADPEKDCGRDLAAEGPPRAPPAKPRRPHLYAQHRCRRRSRRGPPYPPLPHKSAVALAGGCSAAVFTALNQRNATVSQRLAERLLL